MRFRGSRLTLLVVILLMGGCALGYNSALFVTRSNVGINIESTPPTAEISISRQEGIIAPVFEGGRTPALLAGFATGSEGLLRIPFGGRSVFAGGGAAVALAGKPGDNQTHEDIQQESVLCLSQKPRQKCLLGTFDVSLPGPGDFRPMFLASDTAFGVKIAWSGATSTLPDSLVVGYNRKELALAPVFGSNQLTLTSPANKSSCKYGVWLPSFLALLDTRLAVGSLTDTNFSYCQLIATGESATRLGQDDNLQKMVRGIAKGKAQKPEDNSTSDNSTLSRSR
jgi:hypothetical protein